MEGPTPPTRGYTSSRRRRGRPFILRGVEIKVRQDTFFPLTKSAKVVGCTRIKQGTVVSVTAVKFNPYMALLSLFGNFDFGLHFDCQQCRGNGDADMQIHVAIIHDALLSSSSI